jgi:hypothetical protein
MTEILKGINCHELFGVKSRITNAEATVVQKMSRAIGQEGVVILPALTFLLLFVSRQKVNKK